MSKEVRAQLHLSLFGTKISLSLSPDDEDQAAGTELPKSSEEPRAGNVDDPSFSPSSSWSDDEKARPTTEKEALAESVQLEEQADTRSGNKPQLKRPDKPVACPRCNSLDTKFCYYNNYNVNQPRHFCKNCQRYWTAGGTLRNVPVGAGRRKNKGGRGDGVVPRANGNGTVNQESNKVARPGCKRSLDIITGEPAMVRQRKGGGGGGCSEETGSLGSVQRSISCGSDGSNDSSRDDSTCASSVSNSAAQQESKGCFQGILPGAVSNNSAPDNGRAGLWHGFPWPVPAWCPAGWNVNATWNTPWGNLAATAASAAARALADNVGSLQRPNRGPLWAPKTLRINARAGNNTFFADIGTGTKVESISTGGMFKAFHQENSSTQTTLTTASESGEVEESEKVSNSDPTVTA